MMKKLILITLAGSLLAGCYTTKEKDTVQPEMLAYKCSNNAMLYAQVDNRNSSVTVVYANRTLNLPQIVAASGARYSDGNYTFWSKGSEATLFSGHTILLDNCITES